MNASFMIAQVETTMSNYTNQHHRIGMRDLAIWQSLKQYYATPEDYEIVVTSTPEEAFDRMVADRWHVDENHSFFGIDYELNDEQVLEYLKNNALAKNISDDEEEEE